MSDARVEIEQAARKLEPECSIRISRDGISLHWYPELPEDGHKPTRVELMAAGALMGVAGVLTGKGAEDIMRALVGFEKGARRGVKR